MEPEETPRDQRSPCASGRLTKGYQLHAGRRLGGIRPGSDRQLRGTGSAPPSGRSTHAGARVCTGVAMRITRDPALACDATHDAFVQVWQLAGRYNPDLGEPGAWLMTLARYRALDLVRRRGREVLGYEPVEEEPDRGPDPLSQLLANADGGALHRCLQTLSEERRRLIVLAFVEGYSHSQLAARLALPIGTVKSWIRRSLIGLKACLS